MDSSDRSEGAASAERASPGIHVPPPLFFVAAYAAGFGLMQIHDWRPVPAGGRPLAGAVGWTLIGAATLAALVSIGAFVRARTPFMPNRTARALVRGGLYRLTRNPMYVSLTLVYVGVSLATNAGWPLVLVVVPVAIVNFYIIPREEEHLLTRFGPEYEAFRREVRRWL